MNGQEKFLHEIGCANESSMSHNYVIEVDRHFAEIKAFDKEMKEMIPNTSILCQNCLASTC